MKPTSSKRPRRRLFRGPLFKDAIKPIPPKIRALRDKLNREKAGLNGEMNSVIRELEEYDSKTSDPLKGIVLAHRKGRVIRRFYELEGEEGKISKQESKYKKRSHFPRGTIRALNSLSAYQQLKRLRQYQTVKEYLARLNLIETQIQSDMPVSEEDRDFVKRFAKLRKEWEERVNAGKKSRK